MHNKRNNRRRRRKGRGSRIVLNLMMLVAIGVLVFSVYQIVTTLMPYHQGRQLNQQIRDTYTHVEVVAAPADDGVEEVAEEITRERFVVDFDALMETNSDTVAWLRFIEPAIINYPVVRSHDNHEYLTRGFDGTFNQLGSIFLDMGNSIDFSDRNTIIYGHNMAVGGEMFSQLTEFTDIEFTRENPYFFIHTPDGKMRTYRIFMAAVVGDLNPIYQIEFLDDADFEEYLELSRSISLYTIDGDDLNAEALIVTLSTCTNVVATDRFIIQGVLVEEIIP